MKNAKVNETNIRKELLRQLSRAVLMGDAAGGLRLAETARQEFTDRHDPDTGLFRCYEARLFYLSSDYRKALVSSRLAASLLAPFGETEDLASAYLLSGKALVSLGNYREAETAFLDAESLFRRNEKTAGRINTANQLARVYYIRAEYKNTIRQLLKAVKLANHIGDRNKLSYLWGNLGRVYTRLGNFKKAVDSLKLNLEISEELGDDRERAKALLSLGYIDLRSERYEKAETRFDEAYPLLIKEKMRHDLVIYQTYVGQLKTRCGDAAAARRFLNEAIDGARALSPESPLLAAPLRVLAELELACGNLSAASRLANKVLVLTEKVSEPVEKGSALRVLAQVAAAANKNRKGQKKAAVLFGRALEVFDEIDARFEKAEILVIMARSQMGSSRRILANLFRAADLYHRLGIDVKYEKAQELINRIDTPGKSSSENRIRGSSDDPTIVTANRRLKKILRDIRHAAESALPILLVGETGTGKDLLARHYHTMTGRSGRFVAVNCAAFPETLLEAELFGYRKGAFTGATFDKEGLLHRASGGTFFFDEIGEMSLASQAKLLTVIETCRARRLGGSAEEELDIRIVVATNCNLAAMVDEGTFRRDLFYRLSGITFSIPPLTERPEDIPLLVRHFLKKEGVLGDGERVDPALITEFSSRSWPGNVRQLESEVKKLVLFSTMAREDSLGELAGVLVQNDGDGQTASLVNQVEQFEKALILKALRRADWNKSQAARSLAIHESTLRAKMKRYELSRTAIS